MKKRDDQRQELQLSSALKHVWEREKKYARNVNRSFSLSLSNDGELLGLTKLFAKYKFDPDQVNLILLQENALMLRLRIAKSLVLVFSRENQREYSRVNDKIYARLISCI